MIKKEIISLDELKDFANTFVNECVLKQNKNCVLLHGNLGAGKTTFVQFIGSSLGVQNTINSPTFVIMKEYKLPNNNHFKKLVHIDAYRMESKEDIKAFDIDALTEDKSNLLFIEWPDKVFSKVEQEKFINVYINQRGDKREIVVS